MPEDIEKIKERLRPHLSKLEALRVECYATYLKRKDLALYIGVPLVVIALGLELFYMGGLPVIGFILGALIYYWVHACLKPYKLSYKKLVLPAVLKGFGDFKYDVSGCIDMDKIKKTHITPYYNRIKSDDYFHGNIDDIHFEFCELKLQVKRDKNTSTVFKGAAILLTMPFEFQAHTTVGRDIGKFANFLKDKLSNKESVRLENPEFERRYEVYSTDQQSARYILSPAMLERLIDLDTLFYKKLTIAKISKNKDLLEAHISNMKGCMECEFWGQYALFMVPFTVNLFEAPSIEKTVYDLDDISFIQDEIAMMTGIIQQLKIDYLAARKKAYGKIAQS